MFTPQKKLWSLRREPGQNNGSVSGAGSGLNVNALSPRNGEALAKGKSVGFFQGDGVVQQEPLTGGDSELENELFEYQYNMGLLLIEKKEWNIKYGELTQALADATDALKGERAAHLSAMSEVEKREENLKKALGVERQCVIDLEKALHEMRSEYAEIKFNADSKLAEANALVTSVEEKSLEVEAKFHLADAKLAEASRQSSEIERKLNELEAQENALRRDRSSFNTERETHDASISKQRENLREWESKLHEAQERLAEGRRLLNQREEKANDNDKLLKEKQTELEELRRKIEMANSDLRNKEEDISSRLASVALKEKETDVVRKRLEEKEKQLLDFEEKLNAREKVEIQKLLDEHNNILSEKQSEFELEMEHKRKLNDEQLKDKVAEVEKKEAEITHMEEKLKKREHAVEKKMEKQRERETDLDSRSKAFEEREKSLKVEERNLKKERKQMLAEKGDLLGLVAELENLKADTEKSQLRLNEEREQLKITEDERTELTRLQSELKQEIDKYRFQSEQITKEIDDLKQEKEKFERQWEELDEKKADVKKELEDVLEQKNRLEKLRLSEEERLNNEKLETQQYVRGELESLKLAQDSIAARIEHEKSQLAEKAQSEKIRLANDFEMRKQELEAELQRRQEEAESSLHDKRKLFEQEKDDELNNINYLREVSRREMEDVKSERIRIAKEQTEISENKKHVEAQQLEIKKDIEELVKLSKKMKDQREEFMEERERFIAFAEKQQNCSVCGETVREFMLSDLRPLTELKKLEAPPPLPRVVENYLEAERLNAESASPVLVNSGSPVAGGTMSWLKKCTSKILRFSPGKKLELDYSRDLKEETSAKQVGESEPELSSKVANNSSDVQIIETAIWEVETVRALSVDQENSHDIDPKAQRDGPGDGGRVRASRRRSAKAVITDSKTDRNVGTSVYTNDERTESDLLETPKNNRRKRNLVYGSQATISENQTEDHSDSDRPKRRQRVVAAERNVGQIRYNLRQPKKLIGTVANVSLSKARRGKEKEADQQRSENLGASRVVIDEPGSRRFVGEDGNYHVRSTGAASEFSEDSPFKNAGQVDTAKTYVEDVGLSEEVNGTGEGAPTECCSGEDCGTESGLRAEDDDDNNDGDDDEEVDHPGEVSIGKKLWTFLLT